MEQHDDLIRLASIVEDLLAKFNQVRSEKESLERSLAERDQQIQEMEGRISALQTEKQDVSKRVSGILSSIREWEETLPAADKEPERSEPAPSRSDSVTHQLFSMEA